MNTQIVLLNIYLKNYSIVNLDYFESTFLANFEFTKDFKVKLILQKSILSFTKIVCRQNGHNKIKKFRHWI